jgi:hypothetical protein
VLVKNRELIFFIRFFVFFPEIGVTFLTLARLIGIGVQKKFFINCCSPFTPRYLKNENPRPVIRPRKGQVTGASSSPLGRSGLSAAPFFI